jgi:hypothetical protein
MTICPRIAARIVAALGLCLSLVTGCQTDDVVVPEETFVPSGPGHPEDARAFGGHWYKVFYEDGTWHEKKARCEAMGGYLACIETRKEQAFIAKLAKGDNLSLGATDEASEGDWVWVNGAPFKYTCWLEGQPNNWGGDENYLATYDDGEWVDVAADGDDFWMPTGFICEWNH